MRMLVPVIAALFVVAVAHLSAQERSAAGPIDTQMTWTALNAQITSLKTQLDGATARMKQFETCGKKGMLYAPGEAGTDTDGCLIATVVSASTPSIKVQTTTFTENGPTSLPNVTNYCISKGYDASYDAALIQQTTSHNCGGSSGGQCSYTTTTGYRVSCIRTVVQ